MTSARGAIYRTTAWLCAMWVMTEWLPADSTWTGGGVDQNWTTAANWDTPSVNGNNVTFGTGGTNANLDIGFTNGTVTFNRTGGFSIGTAVARRLTVTNGITVSAAESYTIGCATYGTVLVNVTPGGTLTTTNSRFSGVTLTGGGTHKMLPYPQAYEFANEGPVTVASGTMVVSKGDRTEGWGSPWLNVSNGAKVVSWDGAFLRVPAGRTSATDARPSVILGPLGEPANPLGRFEVGWNYDPTNPTVVFGGTGGTVTISVNKAPVIINKGLVILSNLTDNVNNRLSTNCNFTLAGGKLQLLGNDSADTTEAISLNTFFVTTYGLPKVEVLHGAGASATVKFAGPYNYARTDLAKLGHIVKIMGNDLGATSGNRSIVKVGATFIGSGAPEWANITNAMPYVCLGTNEFARYDATRGIYAYEGSRPNSLNGSTSAGDVLITTAQTLSGDSRAASLKINGACPVDLGGYTLFLGTNGFGGALLQTGASNTGGIFNGTLQVQTNNGGANAYLFVQGDRDLTIKATVNAMGITKVGTNKLTLDGTVNLGAATIKWIEGILDVNVPSDFTLAGGIEPNSSLIKRGANTVALPGGQGVNNCTGGITVVAGQLTANRPGPGPITVQDNGTLYVKDGLYSYEFPLVTLDGGTLMMVGGSDFSSTMTLAVPGGKVGTLAVSNNVNIFGLAGTGTLKCVSLGAARTFTLHDASRAFGGTYRVGPQSTLVVRDNNGSYWPTNSPAGGFFVEQGGLVSANASITITNLTYSGFGTNSPGAANTWTSKAGTWDPCGVTTNAPGVLTLNGNLALTALNGTNAVLQIDITGTGSTPGTDHDKLAVTGALTGLSNTPANATVDLVVRTDPKLKGIGTNTYTIVTSTSDFTGKQFRNVAWTTPGAAGTVNYNNGNITLTNVRAGYSLQGTLFILR